MRDDGTEEQYYFREGEMITGGDYPLYDYVDYQESVTCDRTFYSGRGYPCYYHTGPNSAQMVTSGCLIRSADPLPQSIFDSWSQSIGYPVLGYQTFPYIAEGTRGINQELYDFDCNTPLKGIEIRIVTHRLVIECSNQSVVTGNTEEIFNANVKGYDNLDAYLDDWANESGHGNGTFYYLPDGKDTDRQKWQQIDMYVDTISSLTNNKETGYLYFYFEAN